MMTTRNLILTALLLVVTTVAMADDKKFTAAEQQSVSVPTPGLFDRSDSFEIDLEEQQKEYGYSFPLPVGKAIIVENNSQLQITTKKGDAVKAMFPGTVRLSYKHPKFGNLIVIRHDNGLETVYGDNAQNLVSVGDKVKAGQTIAIVGGQGQDCYCTFAVMINGRRINPETLFEVNSHKLRKATMKIKKNGDRIQVSMIKHEGGKGLMSYNPDDNPFAKTPTVILDLTQIPANRWSYPLPGAKVISPYGNPRKGHSHSGVDLKTKPNDDVLAAFDGEVVQSGPYSAYGNFIEIKHAYGFVTRYSHMSKNLVKAGDIVKAGQVIGLVGRSGRATTEHLHFELLCKGNRFDPARIFDHGNSKLKNITIEVSKTGNVKVIK